MKKSLLVMPLLAVLTLAGCGNDSEHTHVDRDKDHICDTCFEKIGNCSDKNNDGVCDWCGSSIGGGGSSVTKPTIDGTNFTITKSTIDFSSLGSNYTYFLDPVTFDAGGVTWTTSGKDGENKGTFGAPAEAYNADSWCNLDVMQIKKGGAGYIENLSGVKGFTKATIIFYADYESEGEQYHPVILQGTEKNPTSKARITSALPQTGVATSYETEWSKGTKHTIHKFVATYSLDANNAFFRITAGSSTSYINSISFEK